MAEKNDVHKTNEIIGRGSTHNTRIDDEQSDVSGEAAGIIRGVSKSVGRSVMKAPIGRLPKAGSVPKVVSTGGILRQRVHIRKVARISDRVSTGWDWWSTAKDSAEGTNSRKQPLFQRAQTFATNLFKNTILGVVVFETFGYAIGRLAPSSEICSDQGLNIAELVDDESDELVFDEPDEYARASLTSHFGAGFLAGTVHGIGETCFYKGNLNLSRFGVINTLQHSLAHSLLFTSYESVKRTIIYNINSMDERTQHFGMAHLTAFGVAGGIAGQVQHIASFYAEQWLGLSNSTLRISFRSTVAPTLRPTLSAFPPSAIGFIAFEYGKKISN